ncbi:hypothetical protein [Carboxylicivirga marina]|uniref:hypothetical protein n=1 Tax=Carboxylicivirga marina TaxID=2800988 RepID=UPI0025957406|nr:hypothetical protein [uncultured Carboxylicivirga sp.]
MEIINTPQLDIVQIPVKNIARIEHPIIRTRYQELILGESYIMVLDDDIFGFKLKDISFNGEIAYLDIEGKGSNPDDCPTMISIDLTNPKGSIATMFIIGIGWMIDVLVGK